MHRPMPLAVLFTSLLATLSSAAEKPNVVLIITDDQGYGDIAAQGNPVLRTPNLDMLFRQSVRLTDYHVDPTCAPTRSALMSGRYSTRVGVWHTINGRSLLPGEELTLAEVFQANGYRTAMFGKWHLGENYPCRPQDQGFEHVICHGGGGVSQGPDYLGNDYFDDTYLVNGEWRKFEGYCTDVWFREALKFIEQKKEKPFFVYLSTNAPHAPLNVEERYAEPYREKGVPPAMSKFYGMIENIDENLGRLRARLEELGLAENTLLIFTTDNGTTIGHFDRGSGYEFFNAGMRGIKGTAYEGGHRVPFFLHWTKGGLTGVKDIDMLCEQIDVLPTLTELLQLEKPAGKPLDGISLAPAIAGNAEALPERTLFAHVQREYVLPKWTRSSTMTERWRLIDGAELYDIVADPGQQKDIAAAHPEVVAELRAEYEKWWKSLEPGFSEVVRYGLGGGQNPMTLHSHDWLFNGFAVWNQPDIHNSKLINGPFMVQVEQAGTYRITPMRWPEYLDRPSGCVKAAVSVTYGPAASGESGTFEQAIELDPKKPAQPLTLKLPAGPASLLTTLTRPDGKTFGGYYVKIERVEGE